jgi:hypothetical protein
MFNTNQGNTRLVVTFKGSHVDGSSDTQVIDVPMHFGFQTYPLIGFSDIVSLTWDQAVFGSVPHQFDNINLNATPGSGGIQGDFNGNGELDVADIDDLSNAIWNHQTDAVYDVNADGQVNELDRLYWITELKRTVFGDANLDGEFKSNDLVQVLQIGEFIDGIPENSTWGDGDFGGDREFDTDDLVLALQTGTYEQGPVGASAVPEPSYGLTVFVCGAVAWMRRRSCLAPKRAQVTTR